MIFDDVIERFQFAMLGAVDDDCNINFKYTSKAPQRKNRMFFQFAI